MGEQKCSLCEGRIVNGRCRECGMVYRRIEGRYHLNENRSAKEKYQQPEARTYQKQIDGTAGDERKKRTQADTDKAVQRIGAAIAVAVILIFLASQWVDKEKEEHAVEATEPVEVGDPDTAVPYTETEEDIYAFVTRELSAEGNIYETKLGAGSYTVGQQIPEGTYRVTGDAQEWQIIYVDDPENGISYTWWGLEHQNDDGQIQIEDVRLYTGAVLRVTGAGSQTFYSENAQTEDMEEALDNPLTQEVELSLEEQVAGRDFEAGMYDLEMLEGFGSVIVYGEKEGADLYVLEAEGGYMEHLYRNLLLKDGMTINIQSDESNEDGSLEQTCTAVLKPSALVYPEKDERE